MLDSNGQAGLSVSQAEAGQKLVAFLARRLEEADAPFLHKWVRTGQVRLNGKRAQPFARVDEGDIVRVPPFAHKKDTRPEAAHGDVPGAKRPAFRQNPQEKKPQTYSPVFEDNTVLVVNKKAGFPSQGGTGHTRSLASEMADLYRAAAYIPAPAHRLDKDTSGLVFAGKTYANQRALQEALADEHSHLEKEYLAWVHGFWPYPEGILEDFLEKKRVGTQEKMVVSQPGNPQAKCARAEYTCVRQTCIQQKHPASLVRVRLLTGRTHQIRVQCASRGFPLWGDGKYGEKDGESLKLHAWRAVWLGRVFCALPLWEGEFAVGETMLTCTAPVP